MVPFRCSSCGTRPRAKLAQLYWAWFRADGERTAWKQRLCVDCTDSQLRTLLASSQAASFDSTMCPSCGADASEDLDPIFLTLYVPRQERLDFELTTCASCAARIRVAAQVGAEKLENRSLVSSQDSSLTAWSSLGLSSQT
jgi:hypothetical protein